jgi:hypothetical protein
MCDLIEGECEKAEADLLAACRQSLAHGALLATRYMLAEMAFNSQKKDVQAALKVRTRRRMKKNPWRFFFGFGFSFNCRA